MLYKILYSLIRVIIQSLSLANSINRRTAVVFPLPGRPNTNTFTFVDIQKLPNQHFPPGIRPSKKVSSDPQSINTVPISKVKIGLGAIYNYHNPLNKISVFIRKISLRAQSPFLQTKQGAKLAQISSRSQVR